MMVFSNFVVAFIIQYDDGRGFYSPKIIIYDLWIMTQVSSLFWYGDDLKINEGNVMRTRVTTNKMWF